MANVEVGSQQKARGASTWGIVVGVGTRAKEWGVGGRECRSGLGSSYHLSMRALELFVGDRKGVHEVYCLRARGGGGGCFEGI